MDFRAYSVGSLDGNGARWSRAIIVFGAVGWCLAIALTCRASPTGEAGSLNTNATHLRGVEYQRSGKGLRPKYLGIFEQFTKWPEGRINWAYNPTNAPPGVSDKVVLESLVESMAQWSAVANIQFIYRGTTRQISMDDYSDGIVAVVWTIPAAGERAGWAARAGPTAPGRVEPLGYSPSVDGSIQLNAFGLSIAESNDPEIFKESLRQYLLHEEGHLIGLGHSDDPRSVLFANPYNYFNYLGEDDVRAASELYGPGSLTAIAPTLPSWSSTGIEDDISAHVIDSERKTVDRISMKGFSWLKPWRSRAIRPKGKLFISLDYKNGIGMRARVDLAESNGVLIATYDIPLRTECGESGINCTWSQTRSLTHTENLALLPGRKHVRVTVDGRSVADQSIVVDSDWKMNGTPTFRLTATPQVVRVGEPSILQLNYGRDPEGDHMSATWHIPGEGEDSSTLDSDGGVIRRAITFDQPGYFEVIVSVTDDVQRYDDSSDGDAGVGFRRVVRAGLVVRNY